MLSLFELAALAPAPNPGPPPPFTPTFRDVSIPAEDHLVIVLPSFAHLPPAQRQEVRRRNQATIEDLRNMGMNVSMEERAPGEAA